MTSLKLAKIEAKMLASKKKRKLKLAKAEAKALALKKKLKLSKNERNKRKTK